MKKAIPVFEIPDYNGAAVYSLVDENGKRYIGSTYNLQQRLNAHAVEFRKVMRAEQTTFMGGKLMEAIKDGRRFRCEILAPLPDDISKVHMRQIERACFLAAGGLDGTYNSSVVKIGK